MKCDMCGTEVKVAGGGEKRWYKPVVDRDMLFDALCKEFDATHIKDRLYRVADAIMSAIGGGDITRKYESVVDRETVKRCLKIGAYWKICKEDVGRELYVVPMGEKAIEIATDAIVAEVNGGGE